MKKSKIPPVTKKDLTIESLNFQKKIFLFTSMKAL